MTHDYSDFESNETDPDILARLSAMADLLVDQELKVIRAEEALKKEQGLLTRMIERDLPNLMEEAEQTEVVTRSGLRIKIGKKTHAHISEANRAKAHKWLEEHGQEKIIKQEFNIVFGKGDEDWAAKFERDCALRKRPLHLKRKKAVHGGTLGKFVRETLEAGDPDQIPHDLFGIHSKIEADVTPVMRK